jgi:hypothetical protein
VDLAHRRRRRPYRAEHPRGDASMDVTSLAGDPGRRIPGEVAERAQLVTPH